MGICLSTTIIPATGIYYKPVTVLKCHFLVDSYMPQPWNITSILKLAPIGKMVLRAHAPLFISSAHQLCVLTGTWWNLVSNTAKCKEWGRRQGKCEYEDMGRADNWSDKLLLSRLSLNPWLRKIDVKSKRNPRPEHAEQLSLFTQSVNNLGNEMPSFHKQS